MDADSAGLSASSVTYFGLLWTVVMQRDTRHLESRLEWAISSLDRIASLKIRDNLDIFFFMY